MKLKHGDIFCVNNGGFFSRAICRVTALQSLDGRAKYSHAGIITSSVGTTFEAKRTIQRGDLKKYGNKPILIGRHQRMSIGRMALHYPNLLREFEGDRYPWWRIGLHLCGMARWIGNGDHLVCSELVARFLCDCKLVETYKGWTPDNLADMIHNWRMWEVVYEGIYHV